MAKTSLVDADLEAGAQLLVSLDEQDLQIAAAMWLLDGEIGMWTYLVATKLYQLQGPRKLYQQIRHGLVQSEQEDRIPFEDIKAVGLNNPLVRAMRHKTPLPGIGQVRVFRSTIGGVFVDDAIVYRALPLPARSSTASHVVAA